MTIETPPNDSSQINLSIATDGSTISFNEFALNESEAKEMHEMLNINGNEPVEVNGITYKRRPLSAKKASFAEKKAELLAARAGEANCHSPPESAPAESGKAGRRPSRRM